jgi:hypothetical protein
MPRIYTKISAIFALAIAIMLLFAFTLWRNVLLVQLASILLALSLVLAINRRSWLWYGIVLFGLSTGAYQAWTHQERFWASLYGITVAYGLIQLFRRMHSLRGIRQWPLTKGGFAGYYGLGGERVVQYTYEIGGSYYSGSIPASLLQISKSQLDVLKGRAAFIRHKPEKPEISVILRTDQAELSH